MSGIGITTSMSSSGKAWRIFSASFAHHDARLVDRGAVYHRIRAREIHILEQARRVTGVAGAAAGVEFAVEADEHALARLHIAQQAETGTVQRHGFRREHVFSLAVVDASADHQRADAVGVAEGHQAVAGYHRHHRVSAAHAAMHRLDGAEHRVHAQLIAAEALGQFVGEHVQQHLGVGVGVDMAKIMAEHVGLEFFGIGQVAVVRQHDAERRIDVEGLRLGQAGGGAGGG